MENKFATIKDRVVYIAERQSISKEDFFKSIGMTSASFRGKAKASPLNSNAIANIITEYPDVDAHWLLTGEYKIFDGYEARESDITYYTNREKDEIIKMLKSQIKDLKADKEDLKELLKLAQQK